MRENSFDTGRVHFVGRLAMSRYRALLRRSNAHVYLTRPFVASWSLLDAMASGCAVVGSDTPPVREIAPEGTAVLVDLDRPGAISSTVSHLPTDIDSAWELRSRARAHMVSNYSTGTVLGRKEGLFAGLI